ncbi:MAG TPA: amino acid adenylation domain-containing protein, partial [Herpetosiphonaceae bacterium]
PLVDLHPEGTRLPAETRLAEARRLAQAEARQPFDLARGPLLRARLLRLEPTEHILVLAIHHSISDGWSMGVLFDELATGYAAARSGERAELPDLPIQYADFAAWQRQWLQGEVLDQQLAYWRQQLGGAPFGSGTPAPPVLELPTDRPRPARQTANGSRHDLLLPQRLADALAALSQQEGTTLFMTLLAAFDVLLHRYSGHDDIVVGSPIAGRTQPETKHLIGCFINTLALRTDLSGNPTFRALLHRVREVCLQAYAHQELPFEKLVEELQPDRDPSHTPIFQVLFVLQNIPAEAQEMGGIRLTRFVVDTQTTTFDLTLTIEDTAEGLKSTFIYNTDLFDRTTIERMAAHWQTLLAGIVAAPDLRIADLPLLSMAERQQIVVEWNATAQEYPHDACLHQLFEAQAARTPDAIAATYEGRSLTYAQLNARANQLAHYLRALGIQPETPVAISVERSIELLVGLLGILKAGGVYVPVDPAYPHERIQLILQDTQAPVLLTQQRLAERLPESQARVVRLDADWPKIAGQPDEPASAQVSAEHLAYMIYTSGSTGRPKGVQVTHRAIVNRLCWSQANYPLTTDDRVLQIASFSFDIAIWELVGPLLAGAQVLLAPNGAQQESAALVAFMAEQQVTVAHFVPSLLGVLLDEPGLDACRALRCVFCGGEALPTDLPQRFRDRLPADLIQLYGPTEASINATAWTCQPDLPLRRIPIGRPIANTRVHVLDARMQPVPIGVAGELHIGGDGLARGYLYRPDLTAARFVPDPFSQTGGARLYRTGDLARYLPDGNVEFLGRADHQVKLRGFRIELGEIEAVLLQHPAVQEAIVVAREDASASGGRADVRLVAYIVGEEQGNKGTREQKEHQTIHSPSPMQGERAGAGEDLLPTPNPRPLAPDLRAYLQERLPAYMVPSAFVFLDALPLNANGKLDRRALPAPEWSGTEQRASFVGPRSELEEVLAEIWAELLPAARIGVFDSFFELGGHSLLATRLVSRIRETFQVEVPLRSLFESPTIAQLNELIEALLIEQLQALSDDEVKRLASDDEPLIPAS